MAPFLTNVPIDYGVPEVAVMALFTVLPSSAKQDSHA